LIEVNRSQDVGTPDRLFGPPLKIIVTLFGRASVSVSQTQEVVMGAKTWMLVYSPGDARPALAAMPALDRPATELMVRTLFPGETLEPLDDGSLSCTDPPDDEVYAGCFPGVSVVAAKEFGIDNPSQLDPRFIAYGRNQTITLHAMHSVSDWFAYAIWKNGTLVRSLSLSPHTGIIENIGEPLAFELPFWSGSRPALDGDEAENSEYPLKFHPLDLGEAALASQFGYQLEGNEQALWHVADGIALAQFKRVPAQRWKLW
jgi:hypothetical protein